MHRSSQLSTGELNETLCCINCYYLSLSVSIIPAKQLALALSNTNVPAAAYTSVVSVFKQDMCFQKTSDVKQGHDRLACVAVYRSYLSVRLTDEYSTDDVNVLMLVTYRSLY